MDHTKDKVGSSTEAAGHMVGKDDFGAHEDDVIERDYVSQETRKEDPGHGTTRAGTESRTAGVGGNDSGRGSSSGGDIDTGADALIGIGDPDTQSPHVKPTAAAPGGRPVLDPPAVNTIDPTRGGVLDNDSSTSAADVNNETEQTGNSFKGDVTADEATGGA